MNLLRKKPVNLFSESFGEAEHGLHKGLGPFDLVLFGVGAIIGTGIFVLTGIIAAEKAGPGIILSFVLSSIACIFAAFCYSEFSSLVPVSGSAYTYSYATFGELIAWMIGWDLLVEYGMACASVASGWSGYFQSLLNGLGINLPTPLTSAYSSSHHTLVDVPAMVIMLVITGLLSVGIQQSARVNAAMVILKIAVVLLFIGVGIFYVKPAHWSPFLPYGFQGVTAGAATAFYAYLGFDAVSTAAEEVRNPQRSMPIGIIGSLLIATILYIAVSAVLTGMVPYGQLNVKDPVSFAMAFVHQRWLSGLISVAALLGITTVLLVMSYGLTRLLFAMSRDGLLPRQLASLNQKKVPSSAVWIAGIVVTLFAGLVPLDKLADLVNIGTLFAFIAVSIGVLVLRKTQPNLERVFKVPFVPLIPILSVLSCGYLLFQLARITWEFFIVWLLIGVVVYFAYSRRHSNLAKMK